MFENTIENLKKENQQLKIDINKIHQLQVKKSFSTQNNSSFSADLNNSISKDSLNNSLEISKDLSKQNISPELIKGFEFVEDEEIDTK